MPARIIDKHAEEVVPPYQSYVLPPTPYTPQPAPVRKRRLGIVLRWVLAALVVILLLYTFVVRPWHLRWGATNEEVLTTLPGDELVSNVAMQSTRAITINAPVEQVWPWLAQLGQAHGGFYSYEWLENLLGCDIHNADTIHSEWQNTQVGDLVRMYHEGGGPPPFTVAAITPGKALVLAQPQLPAGDTNLAGHKWDYSWAFVLDKVDDHTTRLLVRTRSDNADPAMVISSVVTDPGVFIMERGMLLGIKARAEAVSGE